MGHLSSYCPAEGFEDEAGRAGDQTIRPLDCWRRVLHLQRAGGGDEGKGPSEQNLVLETVSEVLQHSGGCLLQQVCRVWSAD